MPASKNIASYSTVLRETIMRLARSSSPLELILPYPSRKKAVNDRAKFYHLRKLMAAKFEEEGDLPLCEATYTVGMRLQDYPDDTAALVIFNQVTGIESAAEEVLKNFLSAEGVAPPAASDTSKEMEELTQRLLREAQQAEEQAAIISQYAAPAFDPTEDVDEEDRKAWEETKRRLESDEDESLSRHAVNAAKQRGKV